MQSSSNVDLNLTNFTSLTHLPGLTFNCLILSLSLVSFSLALLNNVNKSYIKNKMAVIVINIILAEVVIAIFFLFLSVYLHNLKQSLDFA